ncbi:MAG: DUF47 family protein [Clostridia bacterium]|nr:DUF47 family protein [Clostridia bacterium]
MKKKNEFNYFDEFAKSASLAKDAIKELKRFVYNFKSNVTEVEMKKIHEIENAADKKLHDIKAFLLRDFLPPIDREDIVAIAHKIDDLVDDIDELAINICIFSIDDIRKDMEYSIDLLMLTVEKTYDLVVSMKDLKNIKMISQKVMEVNRLEESADRLYEASIRNLYKDEQDPIKVIKWTSVYSVVEDCFDACENIADRIEEVLLKNG